MSLNGPLDYGKSKPRAPRLSGDEGIEQSVTNPRRNPGPLIGYEKSERTRGELRVSLRELMRLKLSPFEQYFAIGR